MKSSVKRVSLFALCLTCLSWTSPALQVQADQSTGVMPVSAEVVASVQIGLFGMDFGSFTKLNEANAETQVLITATNGLPYTVHLDGGHNFQAPDVRGMTVLTSPVDVLTYNLYVDPDRTTIWGDQSFGGTVSAAGTGVEQQFPIYGRVFGGQNVGAGSYMDLVTVTVLF